MTLHIGCFNLSGSGFCFGYVWAAISMKCWQLTRTPSAENNNIPKVHVCTLHIVIYILHLNVAHFDIIIQPVASLSVCPVFPKLATQTQEMVVQCEFKPSAVISSRC
jgi:hypothetical protein